MFKFVVFFLDLISITQILVLLLGPCVDRGPKSPSLNFQWNFFSHPSCRNPTLAKCGGEAQHLEKLEVGSLPGLPNV
jgi:hypothetical protein